VTTAVAAARAGAPPAVICAVPAEARALRRLGSLAVVHVGGIGARPAARAAAAALRDRPAALLCAGFCGAADPSLRAGDLVAAEEVVDGATGRSFAADPALLAAAPGRRGRLTTLPRMATDPRVKLAVGGLAVDMESAAVAAVAADAGVPFLALRAVSDTAGQRLPALGTAIDAEGRLRAGAAARHLARRPREIAMLARIAPASMRAGRALSAGLVQTLGGVA